MGVSGAAKSRRPQKLSPPTGLEGSAMRVRGRAVRATFLDTQPTLVGDRRSSLRQKQIPRGLKSTRDDNTKWAFRHDHRSCPDSVHCATDAYPTMRDDFLPTLAPDAPQTSAWDRTRSAPACSRSPAESCSPSRRCTCSCFRCECARPSRNAHPCQLPE
jgi:hypothetical protein